MGLFRNIAFLFVLPVISFAVDLPEKIEFNRDIRPILSDKCFHCHGSDEKTREAKLRLDIREEAIKDNKGVRAIVPGDLKKSEMIYRITTKDPDEIMPTPKSHKELSKYEIELLKKWVKDGAEYQDHWAFIKPAQASLPKVKNSKCARNITEKAIKQIDDSCSFD